MIEPGTQLNLQGHVAIITGAAQGIGLEYARGLGRAGASVVIADILDTDAAVEQLRREGFEAMGVRADVTKEDSLSEMVRLVLDRYGRIDVLVNNAAIYGTMKKKSWEELTFEDWDPMMRVNVIGAFLAAKAVLPVMCKQNSGSIINISSGSVNNAPPYMAHYIASKAAIIGLTRALAREVGAHQVRVNSISPGLTMSDATRRLNEAGYENKALVGRCIKRHEQPGDLVGTVLFLSSPLSEFMTGQNLIVDGGVAFS